MESADIRELSTLASKVEEHERRITQLEKSGGLLQQVQLTLSEVSVSMKFFGEKLDQLNARLDQLEGEPVRKWNAVTAAVIAAVISSVVGALIGKLLL